MTTLAQHLAKIGAKGGKATAENRTPEQRKAAARKAIAARWSKQKKAKP